MTFSLRTSCFPRYTCQKPIPRNFSDILIKLTSLEKFSSLKNFPTLKKGVHLDNSKKCRTSLPSGLHAALGPRVGHPWVRVWVRVWVKVWVRVRVWLRYGLGLGIGLGLGVWARVWVKVTVCVGV